MSTLFNEKQPLISLRVLWVLVLGLSGVILFK